MQPDVVILRFSLENSKRNDPGGSVSFPSRDVDACLNFMFVL
jgi:hypothetical protein